MAERKYAQLVHLLLNASLGLATKMDRLEEDMKTARTDQEIIDLLARAKRVGVVVTQLNRLYEDIVPRIQQDKHRGRPLRSTNVRKRYPYNN